MNTKIIAAAAAALSCTHDFGSRQEASSPSGVEFKAGVPQRFDFIGGTGSTERPITGFKLKLPDNPLTAGKSATLKVDFYVEGESNPLGLQDTINLHEGAHAGFADTATEPGKQYCAVVTASHDIGCAVLSSAISPPTVRVPTAR